MTTAPVQLRQNDGLPYTFERIIAAPHSIHVELFRRGTAPDMRAIAGWQYRGRNLSTIARLLRIRRYIKGFVALPPGADTPAEIDGYNLWARQTWHPSDPWQASSSQPHGLYKVYRVRADEIDDKYPHALLFNYGRGKNPWYHPGRVLRDYTVEVYPGKPQLLLGCAYVALGNERFMGGYYVMEQMRRADPR